MIAYLIPLEEAQLQLQLQQAGEQELPRSVLELRWALVPPRLALVQRWALALLHWAPAQR